jgi:hypothetical protein
LKDEVLKKGSVSYRPAHAPESYSGMKEPHLP